MKSFLLRWRDRDSSENEESFVDTDKQESTAESRCLARIAELMVQGASCRLYEERMFKASAKAQIVRRQPPTPAAAVPPSGVAGVGRRDTRR